jgi:hypothetical protein
MRDRLFHFYIRSLLPIRDELAWRKCDGKTLPLWDRWKLVLLDRFCEALEPGPQPLPEDVRKIMAQVNAGRR